MPKVIKKKPVKKKTVQEEDVKSVALHAVEKIRTRQKQVIIAASALAVIVIMYAGYAVYSSSMSSKAYELEKEAYTYYYAEKPNESMPEAERWKKALELYKKSIDAKPTPTALYYAGNCYYNLNDYDNAIKEYTKFADKFSGDKGVLPLVYQKLSSAYFKTGQKDKALDILGKLARVNNKIFKDTALVLEARYYDSAGEKEKALERYSGIVSDFPASPWSAEATSKVAAEKAKKGDASPKPEAQTTVPAEKK